MMAGDGGRVFTVSHIMAALVCGSGRGLLSKPFIRRPGVRLAPLPLQAKVSINPWISEAWFMV